MSDTKSEAAVGRQDTPQPSGVKLIAAERERQQRVEGWTPDHDDTHDDGSLAAAASCLASEGTDAEFTWPGYEQSWIKSLRDKHSDDDRLRQLVIAGALIAAEIDRVQRRNDRQSKVWIDGLIESWNRQGSSWDMPRIVAFIDILIERVKDADLEQLVAGLPASGQDTPQPSDEVLQFIADFKSVRPNAHKHLTLFESYKTLAILFDQIGRAHVDISKRGGRVKGMSIDERVSSLLDKLVAGLPAEGRQLENLHESRSPDGDGRRMDNALIQVHGENLAPMGKDRAQEPSGRSAGVVSTSQGDARLHGNRLSKSAAGSEPADSHQTHGAEGRPHPEPEPGADILREAAQFWATARRSSEPCEWTSSDVRAAFLAGAAFVAPRAPAARHPPAPQPEPLRNLIRTWRERARLNLTPPPSDASADIADPPRWAWKNVGIAQQQCAVELEQVLEVAASTGHPPNTETLKP